MWRVAILAFFGTVSAAAAQDETSAYRLCDELAGYRWEAGHDERSVGWDKVDVKAAVPACRQALSETPDKPEIQYRLARTLMQAGDYTEAMPMMLASAEQGYSAAAAAYGTAFLNGKGVAEDQALALRWLTTAANAGNPVAQANLGHMYFFGKGVANDLERAMSLTGKGAEQGVDFAQFNLGWMYSVIGGEPSNLDLTEHWYRLAAEQDYAPALRELGRMVQERATTAAEHAEAIQLLKSAVAQDDGDAIGILAYAYMYGKGVPVNYAQARALLERGQAAGDGDALRMLAAMYTRGMGVPRDSEKAKTLLTQAIMAGGNLAQYDLAMIVFGEGEDSTNQGAAMALMLNAADLGNVKAMMVVAERSARRDDQFHDEKAAIFWYEAAASQGNLEAILKLVYVHANNADFDLARGYARHLISASDGQMLEDAHAALDHIRIMEDHWSREQRIETPGQPEKAPNAPT